MTDIVERLEDDPIPEDCYEAAAVIRGLREQHKIQVVEIKRLREELDRARGLLTLFIHTEKAK